MNNRLLKKISGKIMISGLLLALAACGSSTTMKPSAQEGAGTLGKDFNEIVERAKQEGIVNWWGNIPNVNQMAELEKAFNKRFNSKIKVEQLAIHNNEMGSKLATEKTSGKHTADIVSGSENSFVPWVEEGFLQKIDYVNLFGKDLPGVNEAADHVFTPFKGYGLEYVHLFYCIVYNTKLISEKELPKKWEELADPKWTGQIAVDPSMVAFVRLGKTIGEEATLDLAKRFLDNKPIFGANSPGTLQKVVTGEAKMGTVTTNVVLDQKAKGAPVDFVYLQPLGSAASQSIGMAIGAPNPNAAALFSAWMASNEAMEIMSKFGTGRVRVDVPGADGAYLKKHNLGNPPRLMTLEDLKVEEKLRKKLIEMAAGKK